MDTAFQNHQSFIYKNRSRTTEATAVYCSFLTHSPPRFCSSRSAVVSYLLKLIHCLAYLFATHVEPLPRNRFKNVVPDLSFRIFCTNSKLLYSLSMMILTSTMELIIFSTRSKPFRTGIFTSLVIRSGGFL